MPKWRPSTKDCIYVIPDIHGAYDLLLLILKQILPLRKSDGGKDHLFFLGDYIDRNVNAHRVIDCLIQIKERYPNQIHFCMGNHEEMLLKAFNRCKYSPTSGINLESSYRNSLINGGIATIQGYLEKAKIDAEPSFIPRFRVESLIPKEHWEFMENLEPYITFDKYLFVHAGCNPNEDIAKQNVAELLWSRDLHKKMLKCKENKNFDFVNWEHTIITGHNFMHGGPFIHPNYMMLDIGSPEQLACFELSSMYGMLANPGYKRLISFSMNEEFGVL